MTYDLHNGLTWQTGRHSNLYLSEYDSPFGDATERAVKMHLGAGVPASTAGMSMSYASVLEAEAGGEFTRYYDSSAAAPFLWNAKYSVFISYDDEASLNAKMKYIKSQNLGGVMFWEYTEDTDGRLLTAIVQSLGAKR